MTREHYVHDYLVKTGVLSIHPDGTIWKCHRVLNDGSRMLIPVTPRRAETPASYGYYRIVTKILNKRAQVFAHRLVYFHFFGDIPAGLTINHKNGTKTDNRPENLEVVTQGYNAIHSWHVLKHGKSPPRNEHLVGLGHPMSRFTREEVISIRDKLRAGQRVKDITKEFGLTTVLSISKINLGISYRDVLEDKPITFPILPSPFKPKPKTVAPPLPAAPTTTL